jgi:hypothetical protein
MAKIMALPTSTLEPEFPGTSQETVTRGLPAPQKCAQVEPVFACQNTFNTVLVKHANGPGAACYPVIRKGCIPSDISDDFKGTQQCLFNADKSESFLVSICGDGSQKTGTNCCPGPTQKYHFGAEAGSYVAAHYPEGNAVPSRATSASGQQIAVYMSCGPAATNTMRACALDNHALVWNGSSYNTKAAQFCLPIKKDGCAPKNYDSNRGTHACLPDLTGSTHYLVEKCVGVSMSKDAWVEKVTHQGMIPRAFAVQQ